MTSPPRSGSDVDGARDDAGALARVDVPWIAHGIAAGALGAFVVAAFFLLVDLSRGRPFWTPTVLASSLFLGVRLGPDARPDATLTAAYTVLHGTVFVSFGLLAAFLVDSAERLRSTALVAAAVASGLFACSEGLFLVLGTLLLPGLHAMLGGERVAAANALSSLAMTGFLLGWARPRALREAHRLARAAGA